MEGRTMENKNKRERCIERGQLEVVRDLEILRALARVRFLTKWEIAENFFTDGCPVKERIGRLANRHLIRCHRRGVAASHGYSAWCLTTAGIKAVLDAFPNEQIPSGLDQRLQSQPLIDLEHREAISRVYFNLLRSESSEGFEHGSQDEVEEWVDRVRRADQLQWQSDGDVVIQLNKESGEVRLVPDATVTAPAKRVRLFIEFDRSNKGLSRIEEHLSRYAFFLRSGYTRRYADGFAPWVVFVVKSEGRRVGIARLAERLLGQAGHHARVLVANRDATPWLSEILFKDEDADWVQPAAPGGDLGQVVRAFVRSNHVFLREAAPMFEKIEGQIPEMLACWKRSLHALAECVPSSPDPGYRLPSE